MHWRSRSGHHGGKSSLMSTAEPVHPVEVPLPTAVRASALAAFQLVEDARYRSGRRPHKARRRLLAQRAVAERKAEREVERELRLG
jgi:hypothetical protein